MSDQVGTPNCWFSHAQAHFFSVFEEHLKCYLSKVPTTSTGATCKPAQIATAAAQAAHMAFDLQFQRQGIAELSFDNCVGMYHYIPQDSEMSRVMKNKQCGSEQV